MNFRERCFVIKNEEGGFWSRYDSWTSDLYDADFFETEEIAKCVLESDVKNLSHPAEYFNTAKIVEVVVSVADEDY